MVRTEHDIVSQVRSAKTDPEAADALIRQYMGFIRSETVKFLHTAPENGHEDELSIAMLAFYEAVLAYEKSRGAFLPYAARAIKNRLIDHYRTEKRHGNVISLHTPLGGEEDGTVEVALSLSGWDCQIAPGDEEGRSLTVTLSLHAAALLRREVELTLLQDLYSTAWDLSYEAEPLSLTDCQDLDVRRQSVRELLEIGVVAETLLDISVRPGRAAAVREGEGGSLHCPCRLRALYLDEGGVPLVAERSIDVVCPLDWPEDGRIEVLALCPEEPQGSLGERGVELRFTLEFRARVTRQRQRASIASARMEAADLSALPSLVLRSLGPEETLWDLAKHCRSTVPMILAANGLEGEEAAEAGHLLLVPRKRP